MEKKATIIALSGKGGVGKTSVSAAIVKLLVEAYPDKKIQIYIEKHGVMGLSWHCVDCSSVNYNEYLSYV